MFAKRTFAASIVACALVAGPAAFAADAGAPAAPAAPAASSPVIPAQPSASAIAAADKLLIAMGVKETIAKTVPGMMTELERNLLTSRPDIKTSLETTLVAIKPEFDRSAQQTYGKVEALLALSMPEKDLVDIAGFFTSPLGQKYLAFEPIFFGKLQDVLGPWRDQLSADIVAKAREDLKKKGVDF